MVWHRIGAPFGAAYASVPPGGATRRTRDAAGLHQCLVAASAPCLFLATDVLRFGRIGWTYALYEHWSIPVIPAVAGCVVAAPGRENPGDCALRGRFRFGRRDHFAPLLDAIFPLAPGLLPAVLPAHPTDSVKFLRLGAACRGVQPRLAGRPASPVHPVCHGAGSLSRDGHVLA